MAYEVLPRRTEGGLDVQGEGAQAPSAGVLEHGQLQNVFVQVHGDVGSQLIREVMQQLRKRREKRMNEHEYTFKGPILHLFSCLYF